MNADDALSSMSTPLELDLTARHATRQLRRTTSPLRRFAILTDFFAQTEHLPAIWTASYYRALYPALSACVRHAYVRWGAPARWLRTLRILERVRESTWARETPAFDETIETVREKCCAALACVGAGREMHTLVREYDSSLADVSDALPARMLNAVTLGQNPVAVFISECYPIGDAPPFLVDAQASLESALADAVMPGVLLVDTGEPGTQITGVVLHPEISITPSAQWRAQFGNQLAEDEGSAHRQLRTALEAARSTVEKHFATELPPRRASVHFPDQHAAYSGQSMGLAVALALTEKLQQRFNRKQLWAMQTGICCTGGVHEDGRVLPVAEESLKAKVEAALFSPCVALVLHSALLERAQEHLQTLRVSWPGARLALYGVTSLDDCVSLPGIVRVIERNPYDRLLTFAKRKSTELLLAGIILLLLTVGYFWWKAQYGYPDLEYSSGAQIGQNALVHNPRRASDWQFRDFEEVRAAILDFGDLEIGADATRNLWLWNMTPSTLDVALGIEGEQADQWYISWNGGGQQIPATDSLRVMIKFAPTRNATGSRARFTVRDAHSGELLSSIALHGAAGPPLPGGYALRFDGVDDMLHFGEDAIAFARDEGTLEFWFRLDSISGCVLSNNRNLPYGPASQNMTIEIRDTTISYHIGNHRGDVRLGGKFLNSTGIWHHLAVAFSRKDRGIQIVLDGELIKDVSEEFIIEAVTKPYVTFGAYYNGESLQNPFRGALDEIRMWDRALSADTIRARMHSKLSALTPGLLGYWDFDVIAEVSAFNGNERTQDGQLLHRPAHIRSAVPLTPAPGADVRLIRKTKGATALELQPFRWLQCGTDPVEGSPERSYAIRYFRRPGSRRAVFSVMNQDAYVAVRDSFAMVVGFEHVTLPVRQGWNSVIATVDRERIEVLVNGSVAMTGTADLLKRGPGYRYEGLQVGIFHDKYNTFGPKYYDNTRPALLRTLAVADFCVWKKRLTPAELAVYTQGGIPRDRLAAHWLLDTLPDNNGNLHDSVGGHLLHLWRYLPWM
ncbi:MAG: LamG domain-containing protein [Bacteroidia bacterium]|nr:LamG domain-containing protein [Bacteroidia bacterium]